MGYVAVEAGAEIIERAAELHEKQRLEGDDDPVSVKQINSQFGQLADRVSSESGLAAPELAALAIKQTQGATTEAAFLLRAYRSTLERWGTSETVNTDEMVATRRITPAYKDVPQGQYLGATNDFTPRLLDFSIFEDDRKDPDSSWPASESTDTPLSLDSVLDLLRSEGMLQPTEPSEEEPPDVTRSSFTSPVPRAALLQELARGETGAIVSLAYSILQGYGQIHPTLVELRIGHLPIKIEHPYTGDPVTVTTLPVTEAVSLVPRYGQANEADFAFGYGLVFGKNERKAIGMTVLDASIQIGGEHPAEDEEFVRSVIDGIDSLGFMQHLKLPHYVTFDSMRERIRSMRDQQGNHSEEYQ